jgi:hypothetical protein
MSELNRLIEEYADGPQLLERALDGMSSAEIDRPSPPGKWSTRQIICHLSDFELVYANRIKHVIARDRPALSAGYHDQYAETLAYDRRDLAEERELIGLIRSQMSRILRTLPDAAFERTGVHSVDGPLTLRQLLERITGHIPHHVRFIEAKRQTLAAAR